MNFLFGISHPKQVYMFKNLIEELKKRKHKVKTVVVEKEITEYLMKKFRLDYVVIGKNQPTIIKKILALPVLVLKTLKICRKFDPDILIGQALPNLAFSSFLIKKPFIVFEDTEIAEKLHKITLPFAHKIVTPVCFKKNFGKRQTRFNGWFELAYLHPKRFKPDCKVLIKAGLNKKDKFSVVRFVAWKASHDVGQKGFTEEEKIKIVKELENYGRVFITSEGSLPKELEGYKLKIPPEKIHDLLYYAQLYVGEGGTMATEAAVLGTPSVYVSTVGKGCGNFKDLEKNYSLLFVFDSGEEAIKKSIDLLKNRDTKGVWQKKRQKMLKEKTDVTKWMLDFVENIKTA